MRKIKLPGVSVESPFYGLGEAILIYSAGLVIAGVATVGLLALIARYSLPSRENARITRVDINKDGVEDIIIEETSYPSKVPKVQKTVLYGANREGKIVYLTERP
ncbi:MAG: hypothetical protein Q8N63_03165 [Nanoarchaeota archaeon]|nr:hypothetical protein [Nanoarchaeota archaeon]